MIHTTEIDGGRDSWLYKEEPTSEKKEVKLTIPVLYLTGLHGLKMYNGAKISDYVSEALDAYFDQKMPNIEIPDFSEYKDMKVRIPVSQLIRLHGLKIATGHKISTVATAAICRFLEGRGIIDGDRLVFDEELFAQGAYSAGDDTEWL